MGLNQIRAEKDSSMRLEASTALADDNCIACFRPRVTESQLHCEFHFSNPTPPVISCLEYPAL